MPKRDKLETAKKVGAAFKEILVAASTHPTTAALTVMTLSSLGLIITRQLEKERDDRAWKVSAELDGLFKAAMSLGLASAVAPVAVGALGVTKEAIALKARKK